MAAKEASRLHYLEASLKQESLQGRSRENVEMARHVQPGPEPAEKSGVNAFPIGYGED